MLQVQQRADLDLNVQEIRSKIHAEMEHAYLSTVLRSPDLEMLQIVMAKAIVRAAGLAMKDAETLISTLLLIYHGLAVHEEIETYSRHADERYRQLGVLAGDYYSSKYYRLLAEAGQVSLIGKFAMAIQKINEAKAELERDPSDFSIQVEHYVELQMTIHGALLNCLRETFLPNDDWWEELLTVLVKATVLAKELERGSNKKWSRTLTNLMVWQQAVGEERKWLKHLQAGKGSEHKLLSLHVKYGTSSDVYQQLEDLVGVVEDVLSLRTESFEEVREFSDKLVAFRPVPVRACEEG